MTHTIAPDAPSRPALRYHGAKWNLAPWILSHFPPHELYCEPFAGSLAVLLRKERSLLEVANDLDGEVVGFFRTLREQPDALIRAIELTPYAKAEWLLSFEPAADPVEAARRFYVRAYMSIAGATAQGNTGWRRQRTFSRGTGGESKMTPAPLSFMGTEHLYTIARRLRGVQLEQDDALAVIARYDTAESLFYVDPPYVFATRGKWGGHAYAHEMDDAQHRELAAVLHGVQGMVLLSGYACPLYDELYPDWPRMERSARTNGSGSAVESLWLSPRVVERLHHADLPLFAANGNGHQEAG